MTPCRTCGDPQPIPPQEGKDLFELFNQQLTRSTGLAGMRWDSLSRDFRLAWERTAQMR